MAKDARAAFPIALPGFWSKNTAACMIAAAGPAAEHIWRRRVFGFWTGAREMGMLRKSLFGIAMIATAGVAMAEPAATGTTRNQAALSVAGRITPQMRAVAQQCAAVVGRAARAPCAAGGVSHLAPVTAGAVVVGLGATATVIWAVRNGTHGSDTTAPTPIPVSS